MITFVAPFDIGWLFYRSFFTMYSEALNYFSFKELTVNCSPGERSEVLNDPKLFNNMCQMVVLLNLIRHRVGVPVYVNSGYRGLEHNKRVGGVTTSQHRDMEAVDIRCSNNKWLLDVIMYYACQLGQVIVYHNGNSSDGIRFIHVALPCDRHLKFELSYKKISLS